VVHFSQARLEELFHQFIGKRIAVVGDLMLDRYFWGTVNRISPEAPVPVVEIESESARLGGAANVANNIKSLGGEPLLIGTIGDDNSGAILRELVEQSGFCLDGLIVDSSRPTTVKTRVIAHGQHVVRIDREVRKDITREIQQQILDVLYQNLPSLNGVIIEDYNKGVIVRELIADIVQHAREHNVLVTADPKFNNFFAFKHVTVFKPNRKEVEEALGVRLINDEHVEAAGKEILSRLEAESVLLTRGEKGMSLFESDGTVTHVPTKARKVADVSGAGDTVISTLTIALAAGASLREAASLANFAGGVVCGEVGIVPIDLNSLKSAILDDESGV
jgi:rfaE bifunctional protein kinase chain/domain